MSMKRNISAASLVVLVAGCGGGGGSGTAPTGTPAASSPAPGAAASGTSGGGQSAQITYSGTVLPGRLMLTGPFGDFHVYDLASGAHSVVGTHNAQITWMPNASGTQVMSATGDTLFGNNVAIAFYDARTWQQVGTGADMRANFVEPKPSADGKYIVTYWRDENEDATGNNPLTIFDAATGAIVKRGSQNQFNSEFDSLIASPVAWLPDDSYVYLAGSSLYGSYPDRSADVLIAKLALPPTEDSSTGRTPDGTHLVASPDGKRLAFTWLGNIWVVDTAGTNLHQLTKPFDDGMAPNYQSPTWSPDSQWVAGTRIFDTTVSQNLFPDPVADDDVANPVWTLTPGACLNPVFVLKADGPTTAIPWAKWDPVNDVKVRYQDGRHLAYLQNCSSEVHWLP